MLEQAPWASSLKALCFLAVRVTVLQQGDFLVECTYEVSLSIQRGEGVTLVKRSGRSLRSPPRSLGNSGNTCPRERAAPRTYLSPFS